MGTNKSPNAMGLYDHSDPPVKEDKPSLVRRERDELVQDCRDAYPRLSHWDCEMVAANLALARRLRSSRG